MKAAIYARVSRENEKSVDAQIEEGRRYAESRGWPVIQEYREDGHPASREQAWQRPVFNRMLSDAEAGRFEVLVVCESSRISRNALHAKIVKRDLREMGVAIAYTNRPDMAPEEDDGAFVQESIDEMLDEMESRRTARRIRRGKQHRAERGLWVGDLPWGFCRGNCSACIDPNGPDYCPGQSESADSQAPIPHPRDSDGVLAAFRASARGDSDMRIAQMLNRLGYRTNRKHTVKDSPKRPGGPSPFTKDTVRRVLMNPFYLGYLPYKGRLLRGNHPALITPELFAAAQEARKMRRYNLSTGQPDHNGAFILTGILRCSHGHRMRGQSSRSNRYYMDHARVEQGRDSCDQITVRADVIEQKVTEIVTSCPLPDDWQEAVRRYLFGDEYLQEYERKRLSLAARQERLKRMYLDGLIADEEYNAERDEINRQQAELSRAELPEIERAGELLISMREVWSSATSQERHKMLKLMFEAIIIKEDEITAVRPTAAFHPLLCLLLRKRRDSDTQPLILPPRKGEHEHR